MVYEGTACWLGENPVRKRAQGCTAFHRDFILHPVASTTFMNRNYDKAIPDPFMPVTLALYRVAGLRQK